MKTFMMQPGKSFTLESDDLGKTKLKDEPVFKPVRQMELLNKFTNKKKSSLVTPEAEATQKRLQKKMQTFSETMIKANMSDPISKIPVMNPSQSQKENKDDS